MQGAFATVGAKLVERGYAAIPIMIGTKRPGYLRGGEWIGMSDWHAKYARRLPTQFEIDVWSNSDAGVCVVCGPGSNDLVAIDIDTDRPEIVAAIRSVLPPTPVMKRGAKGETAFYRCPNILLEPASSFNLDKTADNPRGVRVCDVIGPGRQTVLPPSIHPDTAAPYEWTGQVALEDIDPEDIPMLAPNVCARIAGALKPFGYEAEPPREPLAPGGVIEASNEFRQLNDIAMDDLAAWVPRLELYRCRRTRDGYEAVATWRASNTGQPETKRKRNLKIHRTGIRDFGDDRGYTPIDLVMAAQGCDLDTAFTFFAGIAGWEGLTNPITIGRKKGKAAEPLPEALRPPDPFLGMTEVPGVLGQLIDWITDTSRRPNRILALGAAVTIIGTLIGRRVATPTQASTHLYFITLARSGAGKDHALNAIPKIMNAVDASQHVGPGSFMSASALSNHIAEHPLSVSPMDEFGAFLKKINHRRGSSHEQGIKKILRTVWGKNFEPFITDRSAAKQSVMVQAPCFSIYGASTPDEFYSGLEGFDIKDGFLNRFLVVSTEFKSPPLDPVADPFDVPQRLKSALSELYLWGMSSLALSRLNDHDFNPRPFKIEWGEGAAVKYRNFERHIESIIDADPEANDYLARTAEMAGILATIRAVGRAGAETEFVALDDLEWGMALADEAGQRLRREAPLYTAENERQSWSNKILRTIKSRGARGATPRVIQQYLKGALKSAEIKDILATLLEAGAIERGEGCFVAKDD